MFNRCPTNFIVSNECCVPSNLVTEDIDTNNLISNISVSTSMYPTALLVDSLSTYSAYAAIVIPSNVLSITSSQVAQGFSTVCSRTGGADYNITLPTAPQLAAKELEIHGVAVIEGQRLLPIIIHNTAGTATLMGGNGVTLFPTSVSISPNKTATCILSFISATQVVGLCSVSS